MKWRALSFLFIGMSLGMIMGLVLTRILKPDVGQFESDGLFFVGGVAVPTTSAWTYELHGTKATMTKKGLWHSATLTIESIGKLSEKNSVHLRYDYHKLLIVHNASGAEILGHSITDGKRVCYEGFILDAGRYTVFEGWCGSDDKEALSQMQEIIIHTWIAV